MEVASATWKECEELLKKVKVAILPVGSVEEHGYHLPLNTDTITAYEISLLAAQKKSALVLPPVTYGICRTTSGFPGTITLSFDTMRGIIEDILEGLVDQGVEKIILLCGHWGSSHLTALREAVRTIKQRKTEVKILLIPLSCLLDDEAKSLLEAEKEGACHAGEMETSLMLALKPNLVKMDKAEGEHPKLPKFTVEISGRKWMRTGVIMGEPQLATKEKGEVILRCIVENLAGLL
jgi:creatinine amidohydrolase